MRKAKPDRDVRVVALDGPHCLLLDSDHENYTQAIIEALQRDRLII